MVAIYVDYIHVVPVDQLLRAAGLIGIMNPFLKVAGPKAWEISFLPVFGR